jgi:hypothetical protein
MTETEPRRFEKHVAIKEVDEEERTATGAVLVPWEVDRQGDWPRPEGVGAMYNPDPDDGVMHARFPDDAAELVENALADEPIELGGETFPAGTWYVTRKYHDDELWGLIRDEILTGFSIGGEVSQVVEYESADDLPDEVAVPDAVDIEAVDDDLEEIVNGFTTEVSDVDIPAVPSATYATAKSIGKSIVNDVAGEEEFVDVFADRGHTEEDARRLWSFLDGVEKRAGVSKGETLEKLATLAADADTTQKHDMSTNPTDPDAGGLDDEDVGFLKRLRKAVMPAGPGPGADVDVDVGDTAVSGATLAKAATVVKEGRTLNQENRNALMAAHDAIEAALASDLDDIDYQTNRFSDDTRFDFDLTAYSEKVAEKTLESVAKELTPEQAEIVADTVEEFATNHGDATVGDFREWSWEMEWAEELSPDQIVALQNAFDEYHADRDAEENVVTDDFADWLGDHIDATIEMTDDTDIDVEQKLDELEKRIDDLADDGGDGTSKGAGADDGSGGDEDLEKQVEELQERLDKLSQSTAGTDQLGGNGGNSETGKNAVETEKQVFTR